VSLRKILNLYSDENKQCVDLIPASTESLTGKFFIPVRPSAFALSTCLSGMGIISFASARVIRCRLDDGQRLMGAQHCLGKSSLLGGKYGEAIELRLRMKQLPESTNLAGVDQQVRKYFPAASVLYFSDDQGSIETEMGKIFLGAKAQRIWQRSD